MKRLFLGVFILSFIFKLSFSQEMETTSSPFSLNVKPFPYSQLIGFKFGGAYYIFTGLSESTMGVFFENVVNKWLGMEIEMGMYNIPITNYTLSGTTYSGNGMRKYIELSGGFKFYVPGVTLYLGLSYNDFISGYLITSSPTPNIYVAMSDQEINFFAIQTGAEVNAQISSDLFSKVGVRFVWGYIPDTLNYTMALRFFISFAYGL